MIYHATMLYILFVNVVSQLDREWCPLSLGMTTSMATLLVKMMHGWVDIDKVVISHMYVLWLTHDLYFSVAYKKVWLGDVRGLRRLQSGLSLCDYKVWIDTKRGEEAISYLCLMARLDMMEE
jgi:hypothetical protein